MNHCFSNRLQWNLMKNDSKIHCFRDMKLIQIDMSDQNIMKPHTSNSPPACAHLKTIRGRPPTTLSGLHFLRLSVRRLNALYWKNINSYASGWSKETRACKFCEQKQSVHAQSRCDEMLSRLSPPDFDMECVIHRWPPQKRPTNAQPFAARICREPKLLFWRDIMYVLYQKIENKPNPWKNAFPPTR